MKNLKRAGLFFFCFNYTGTLIRERTPLATNVPQIWHRLAIEHYRSKLEVIT